MKSTLSRKDQLGNDIEVGDFVAYNRYSNYAQLSVGYVVGFTPQYARISKAENGKEQKQVYAAPGDTTHDLIVLKKKKK
jgi:hypothetical protein